MRHLFQVLRIIGPTLCMADALRHYRGYRRTGESRALARGRTALLGASLLLGNMVVWWVYS
jgi:hypothetical protein